MKELCNMSDEELLDIIKAKMEKVNLRAAEIVKK